ncbi:MAG: hypothetical protein JEZ07_16950 [Phycisphaerae bacterium]|nr:hypothetical protein [Phycisphaerae bacterium]
MHFRLLEPIIFYGLALAASALFGVSYITGKANWQSYALLSCSVILIISATGYCWHLAQESIISKIKLHNRNSITTQPATDTTDEQYIDQLQNINEDLVGMLDMIKEFEQNQKSSQEVESETELTQK